VTWDSEIIPSRISEPAKYPGGKELITFGPVTDDQRAEYFARYTTASLGKIKNLYLKWARLGDAMSPQCQQLNRLFSQCVDGNYIRIPENLREFESLQDAPEPDSKMPAFILDVLHNASVMFLENALQGAPSASDDANVVDLLLSRDQMALSEFEMIRLTLRWCNKNGVDIMKFGHLFNFSALSDEQQIWFLSSLPPSQSAPGLVRNGLLQSTLVDPGDLQRFSLDNPHLHWKPIFYSATDRMGRFFDVLCRSLETFHKKLVILAVDERLTLAIYIPRKIPRASECQVDTAVRVFAIPHSKGSDSCSYKVLPTKINYRLYCDEHHFRLYERKRGNTWIFMTRPQVDDSLFRNEKRTLNHRRKKQQTIDDAKNFDCVISVALDKIGRDIHKHVGQVQRQGILNAVSCKPSFITTATCRYVYHSNLG
jgi:regulator of nonsense transcripts 1